MGPITLKYALQKAKRHFFSPLFQVLPKKCSQVVFSHFLGDFLGFKTPIKYLNNTEALFKNYFKYLLVCFLRAKVRKKIII